MGVGPMAIPAATDLDPSSLLLLAGVVIVVTMIMISTRRRAADRGSSPRAYAREQLAKVREQEGMRDDLQELMMQLEKLAREINAQVDTRFAKLEKAIADADARLAELKRLGVGEATPVETVQEQPADGPVLEPRESTPTESDRGKGVVDEVAADSGDATADEPVDAAESVERRIVELSRAGKSPLEIARALGRDVGEVELIIKLKGLDDSS